jgi:hypothetical protein
MHWPALPMMHKRLGTGEYLSLASFHDLAGQEIFVEDHEHLHEPLSLSDYYIAVRSGGGGRTDGREEGNREEKPASRCALAIDKSVREAYTL